MRSWPLVWTTLAVVVAAAAPALSAGASGDVTFAPPLRITGDLAIGSGDGALHISVPDDGEIAAGDAGLAADGVSATFTLVTWDIQTVGTTVDGRELFVDLPSDPPQVESWEAEAASVQVTGLRPSAQVLVGADGALKLDGAGGRSVLVARHDAEFRVDDFQRSGSETAGEPSEPWHFTYRMEPPYFGWVAEAVAFDGAGTLYAWEADVEICAAECRVIQTGRSLVDGESPATRTDRFVWLVASFGDIQGTVAPIGAELAHYAPAMDIATLGTVELPRAEGGLRIGDRTYAASGGRLVLDGDVRLRLSPVGDGATGAAAGRRADADVSGDVRAINLEPLAATAAPSPGTGAALPLAMAALGLAAAVAVVVSRKRIGTVLAQGVWPRRERREFAEVDTTADPLLHPDRHRIYYLLQRRGVLTATEAETALGVPDAARHMELLADGGLIRRGIVERSGRRSVYYAFPGREFEDRAERLLLLGDASAARLAELLDMYGEVEADTLTEAARRATPHLPPQRTRALLDVFRSAGLVREEDVAGVTHLAPTPELRTCLLLHSGRSQSLHPA